MKPTNNRVSKGSYPKRLITGPRVAKERSLTDLLNCPNESTQGLPFTSSFPLTYSRKVGAEEGRIKPGLFLMNLSF